MGNLEQDWFRRRTTRWTDWPAVAGLELKQRPGARISVVVPARNEERYGVELATLMAAELLAVTVRSPAPGQPGSGQPGSGGPR